MSRWSLSAFVRLLTGEIRLDLQPLWRVMKAHPEVCLLAIGVGIRVYTYAMNRAMWLDELMLKGNVVEGPVLDFSAGLHSDQLAPLGFLVVERVLAALISGRNHVLRFLPLAAGVGSVFLYLQVARNVLPARAVLVALTLFALSDELNYYSSEFKPYSLDVFFGVATTLLAVISIGRDPSRRAILWLAAIAGTAPWFSFPSAFVIAGCGGLLLLEALLAARFRAAAIYAVIGIVWLDNFAVAYFASRAMLSPDTTMFRFWDFAFLRFGLPPSLDDLSRDGGLLLEVFANPLNLVSPARVQLGVILPLSLLVAGTVSLCRRSPWSFLLLPLPIALALAAATTRHYPFHGRLILVFVPALFLLIAEGTQAVARWLPSRSEIVYKTVLVALLALPSWEALNKAMTGYVRDFNIHGDMRPNVFIDIPVKRPVRRPHHYETKDRSRGGDSSAARQKVGIETRFPPFVADSWAQSPTMVQLAEVSASGSAGRSPRTALRNAWTRCGCEPPCPPPWVNERCCSPSPSPYTPLVVNRWIGPGSSRA
jgi:hypothetical protein